LSHFFALPILLCAVSFTFISLTFKPFVRFPPTLYPSVIDSSFTATETMPPGYHRRRRQRFLSPQSKYRSVRLRRPSVNDGEGEIYVLEGTFKGRKFLKIGRSVDSERRFKQHRKTCPGVVWNVVGSWEASNCHKAGELIQSSASAEFLDRVFNSSFRVLYTREDALPGVREGE
jgi:hypothetical protein